MKYLLIFSRDWSDEFDCEQFALFEKEEEALARKKELIQYGGYFGTNEGFEEEELSERDFQLKDISDEDAAVIRNLLGQSFGTGIL